MTSERLTSSSPTTPCDVIQRTCTERAVNIVIDINFKVGQSPIILIDILILKIPETSVVETTNMNTKKHEVRMTYLQSAIVGSHISIIVGPMHVVERL
jgi:hypothetical protein